MNARILFVLGPILLLCVSSIPIAVASSGNDDLFGYHFDPNLVPSNTIGTYGAFSVTTTAVSLTSGTNPNNWCAGTAGWMAAVHTLHTNTNYVLQASITLARDTSGNYKWYMIGEYFDASGHYTCSTIQTPVSAQTYPSASGWIKIFYNGVSFVAQVYLSQNGQTYSYTYPTAAGTTVSSASNDWTAVETGGNQTGVTLAPGYEWHVTNTQFDVSGTWKNYNVQGSGYTELEAYETYQPGKAGNKNGIGTWPLTTPGVKAYVGSTYGTGDGEQMVWCISGTCPLYQSP